MELTYAKPVEMLAATPGADRCYRKNVAMDNRLHASLSSRRYINFITSDE
jgi:hypothetical protein